MHQCTHGIMSSVHPREFIQVRPIERARFSVIFGVCPRTIYVLSSVTMWLRTTGVLHREAYMHLIVVCTASEFAVCLARLRVVQGDCVAHDYVAHHIGHHANMVRHENMTESGTNT